MCIYTISAESSFVLKGYFILRYTCQIFVKLHLFLCKQKWLYNVNICYEKALESGINLWLFYFTNPLATESNWSRHSSLNMTFVKWKQWQHLCSLASLPLTTRRLHKRKVSEMAITAASTKSAIFGQASTSTKFK